MKPAPHAGLGRAAHGSGRLFASTRQSGRSRGQLPQLTATLPLNVFVYSGSAGAAAPTATPTAEATTVTAIAAGGTP